MFFRKESENVRHRNTGSSLDGYPENHPHPLSPDDAYEAVIALEDTREKAREALARARELTKGDQILHGEIIAWRAWTYDHETQLLRSWMSDAIWPTDEPLFAPSVSERFGNGIHAFKTRRQAERFCSGIMIYGSVKLWGSVIEHTQGYKAEFAQVNSIDYVSSWHVKKSLLPFAGWRVRRQLRRAYGLSS